MNLSAGNTKAPQRALLGAALALLTACAAAVPAFAWTDNPLTTSTPVRKVHMDELRAAANAKVVTYGFPPRAWVDDPTITAGVTLVRAVHITEIRGWITVIRAFYGGVCPGQIPATPPWTETLTAGSTPIRVSHTTEVRSYIDAIGNGDTCCAVCKYPAGYSGCQNIGYGASDTGCGGYNCYTACDSGSTEYNCRPFVDKYLCNGAGGCTLQPYQDCGVGYCSGGAIYYYTGCDNTNGCTGGTYSYPCTASDGCYSNAYWYHYGNTCVGNACEYALHYCSYGTEKFCIGNDVYTYNGCSGSTCYTYPYPYQTCSGYYCVGEAIYQYTGCSGGACSASNYITTCAGGSAYCSDGCTIAHPSSCSYGSGSCTTWYENCCSGTSGYCSGGYCYY